MGRKSKCKSRTSHYRTVPQTRVSILGDEIQDSNDRSSSSDKMILITDRLSLPPFRNDHDFSDGDAELQLDIRPRRYFATGLCYSCSKSCQGHQEFPCEGCRMVSYCTPEHRRQDASSHADLCLILAEINQQESLDLARGLNAQEYRSFRAELLHTVEGTLNRILEPKEREVMLYPRLCCVCRGSQELERCFRCHIVHFCPGEHAVGHEDHCAQFRVFGRILEMESGSGFVAPRLPTFSARELPEDFDGLVKKIFQKDYEKIDCTSYAALSQVASPVLTALHVIRNSARCAPYRRQQLLKIHVIGAELQFECANVTLWEKLFLHLLPDIGDLRLEFFGPELQVPTHLANILKRPALCLDCSSKNRNLHVILHCGKLYHQVKSDKPDLVCLFNPGLYRMTGYSNQDTWSRTIEKFCDYQVPIVVTSYTEVELPRDLARIRELREVEIEEGPRRNPFASLRPERNFVSDEVVPFIYKNYFVAVVVGSSAKPSCQLH